MTEERRTALGVELENALGEVRDHLRGEIELGARDVDTMSKDRVRTIRKAVAKSPRDFERRFHIPARTLEGWEQGRRKPDLAARLLLTLIEKDPEAVERALGSISTDLRREVLKRPADA